MMISQEPFIKVGLIEHATFIVGVFEGNFEINGAAAFAGDFKVRSDLGSVVLDDGSGNEVVRSIRIACRAAAGSQCRIRDITIGRKFHWERKEDQVFSGTMIFCIHPDGSLMIINEIPLENYLTSVISSEMNSSAPLEFLKAHAVVARSWLAAMTTRKEVEKRDIIHQTILKDGEIMRWYGREDHLHYDVCADDHCQRYHGLDRIQSGSVIEAVGGTRGRFLVYDNEICDARYSKSCGGWTEKFESVWEDVPVPYLICVNDSSLNRVPLTAEKEFSDWIKSTPEAYCSMNDESILRQILSSFDQETKDFYRWSVSYEREELENIILEKSGIDFGTIIGLLPVERGPSGRIIRLKVIGTKRAITVGKELEIRRWLSRTHLKSSAFIVETEPGEKEYPRKFIFHGAGWGHGVGLCQIGAAVMAIRGADAEKILQHYYQGATVLRLY